MPGSFLDSNVILYMAGRDPEQATRARALVAAGGWISVQVLNEVANVARRKMQLEWPAVHELLALMRSFLFVEPVSVATHEQATAIAERYRLAIFDSSILASALLAGCDTLLSEDMHDGLVVFERLTIRNPFA